MDADFHSDLLNRSSEKFIEMQKRIRSSVSEVFFNSCEAGFLLFVCRTLAREII